MESLKKLIEQYEKSMAFAIGKEGELKTIHQELEIKNKFIREAFKISESEEAKKDLNLNLDEILIKIGLSDPKEKNLIDCLTTISNTIFKYFEDESKRIFKEDAEKYAKERFKVEPIRFEYKITPTPTKKILYVVGDISFFGSYPDANDKIKKIDFDWCIGKVT